MCTAHISDLWNDKEKFSLCRSLALSVALSLCLSVCLERRFLSAVQLIPRRAALCQMSGKCPSGAIWELRASIVEIHTSWDVTPFRMVPSYPRFERSQCREDQLIQKGTALSLDSLALKATALRSFETSVNYVPVATEEKS